MEKESGETHWRESVGRLTDKLVAAMPPPASGNRVRWDGELAGFGLRVTSAGAKAFVFRYRNADGRDRTLTIGSPPAWTVAKAAKAAAKLRYDVDNGADPLAERQGLRGAPTVNDLADRFEAEHLPKLRPITARDYRAALSTIIRPALGGIKVAALRYSHVDRLHRDIAKRAPYRANRVVALLSKMLALAIKWEMRAENPCRGVEKAPEHKRERFLSPAEIIRLGDALKAHPERPSANAIRLLLLTGARRGEVLGMTWEQIDLDSGVWTKPAHTTKQAKLHRVPLSAPALALLTEIKSDAVFPGARFVFPSTNGSLTEIKKSWAAVCKAAGISGVRIHDLRHSYASILVSSGLSLPIIGALLGHTQPATTARYAHLLDDPLRAATERAGAIISGTGKPGGDVVPLRRWP